MKKLDAYSITHLSAQKLDRALHSRCGAKTYLAMRGCVPEIAMLVASDRDDQACSYRAHRVLSDYRGAGGPAHTASLNAAEWDELERMIIDRLGRLRRALRRAGLYIGVPAVIPCCG